jgi:hypothetical protein
MIEPNYSVVGRPPAAAQVGVYRSGATVVGQAVPDFRPRCPSLRQAEPDLLLDHLPLLPPASDHLSDERKKCEHHAVRFGDCRFIEAN